MASPAWRRWDHEVFRVEYPHQSSIARSLNPPTDHSFTFTPTDFSKLYPFHLLFDTECRVVQAGAVFCRVVPGLAQPRAKVSEHLRVSHPHGVPFEFAAILPEVATTFVLRDPKTSTDFKARRGPRQTAPPPAPVVSRRRPSPHPPSTR